MADNFDDKNLFGDSFDLFQSDSSSLFGNNATNNESKQNLNSKANNSNKNLQTQKTASSVSKTDFGFDNNLFGGDLFGSNDLSSLNNAKPANQAQTTKSNQAPTNLDFGFDDNNLFGETTLPQDTKQDVPTNLFDSSDDLFGNDEKTQGNAALGQEPNEQEFVEEQIQQDAEYQEDSESDNISEGEETEELLEDNEFTETEDSDELEEDLPQDDFDGEQEEAGVEKSNKTTESTKKQTDAKPEKPKKIKPEKTPEQKEKEKKRNKLIILISAAALALILSVVCIIIFANQPGDKFKTPEINVYHRDSGTVLMVNEQSGAQGYEVVVSQEGKSDTVFTSKNGTIELRLYFNEPGVFNVKVRVLGAHTVEHSDFSDSKRITNYVKLDTPKVFKNDNILSWNKVPGAVAYRVYYRANVVDNVVEFIELDATENLTTFDMTQLNDFGAGLYPVCVMAVASGEYMLNSDYTEAINYAYISSLDAPILAGYDSQTKTLSFVTLAHKTQADRYLIVASLDNGTELANHYAYANDIQKKIVTQQGMQGVLYTVCLNEIIAGEPSHLTIKAIGDGIYSSDSEIIDVVMM